MKLRKWISMRMEERRERLANLRAARATVRAFRIEDYFRRIAEFAPTITERQRARNEALRVSATHILFGADAVLEHWPHVLSLPQPTGELYDRRNPPVP